MLNLVSRRLHHSPLRIHLLGLIDRITLRKRCHYQQTPLHHHPAPASTLHRPGSATVLPDGLQAYRLDDRAEGKLDRESRLMMLRVAEYSENVPLSRSAAPRHFLECAASIVVRLLWYIR